jgi:iron(III) transport system substrate-binding protein
LRFLVFAFFALLLTTPLFANAAKTVRFELPETVTTRNPDIILYSNTDIDVFKPVIEAYMATFATSAVVYHELQSTEIYERVISETASGEGTANIVISSAMDLQMKLVNDGYAKAVSPANAGALPAWANWRNEAFGTTFEPAVIAYNKAFFKEGAPPQTRDQLAKFLVTQNTEIFGKIATYDAERSGLGFLFLARDSVHGQDIWSLTRRMGASGVKLYTSSSAILDRIANGSFILGYNLLGSYAEARAITDSNIGIILPQDYTVVLSRIALIPRQAKAGGDGIALLDFLLSKTGQSVMANRTRLNAINRDVTGPNTAAEMQKAAGSLLRPIKVGPGLLVYLDQVKRQKLLKKWQRALSGR